MALTLFEDTFVTVNQASTFLGGDLTWIEATDSEKESALRNATNALDDLLWAGYAATTTQTLSWPRKKLIYFDPKLNLQVTVEENEVPQRLRRATANLALHYLLYPSAVDNYDQTFERIKLGPLEVEDTKTNNSVPAVPFNDVQQLVEPLLRTGLTQTWWRAN